MKKLLMITGVLAIGALAVARWTGGGADGDRSDPGMVVDRLWIDQLPTRPRDTMNLFVALTEQPMGIFQAASQWKGTYEIFQYTASGDELRVVYPQSGEKEKVKTRASRCKQRDMDYCLELGGASRGVKRYYSMDGWEIGRGARPEEILGRAAAIVQRATGR